MMLPESEIDPDDYPKGPWGKARYLEGRIAELEGFKAMVPRAERRPINQQLHTLRELLAWCDSVVGIPTMFPVAVSATGWCPGPCAMEPTHRAASLGWGAARLPRSVVGLAARGVPQTRWQALHGIARGFRHPPRCGGSGHAGVVPW